MFIRNITCWDGHFGHGSEINNCRKLMRTGWMKLQHATYLTEAIKRVVSLAPEIEEMPVSRHEQVRWHQDPYLHVDDEDSTGARNVVNQDDQLHPALPLVRLVTMQNRCLHTWVKAFRWLANPKDQGQLRAEQTGAMAWDYTNLFGGLCEEEAQGHHIAERQQEVDVRIMLVLLHEEAAPAWTTPEKSFVIASWLELCCCDFCSIHKPITDENIRHDEPQLGECSDDFIELIPSGWLWRFAGLWQDLFVASWVTHTQSPQWCHCAKYNTTMQAIWCSRANSTQSNKQNTHKNPFMSPSDKEPCENVAPKDTYQTVKKAAVAVWTPVTGSGFLQQVPSMKFMRSLQYMLKSIWASCNSGNKASWTGQRCVLQVCLSFFLSNNQILGPRHFFTTMQFALFKSETFFLLLLFLFCQRVQTNCKVGKFPYCKECFTQDRVTFPVWRPSSQSSLKASAAFRDDDQTWALVPDLEA